MQNIWIVTANSSKLIIYSHEKHNKELSVIKTLEHIEALLKEQDRVSDRPGSFSSSGALQGIRTSAEPKEIEDERFAKTIAELLEQGRVEHNFNKLIIIATPNFLGELKLKLNKHLLDLITLSIPKDLTKLTKEDLLNILKNEHRSALSELN